MVRIVRRLDGLTPLPLQEADECIGDRFAGAIDDPQPGWLSRFQPEVLWWQPGWGAQPAAMTVNVVTPGFNAGKRNRPSASVGNLAGAHEKYGSSPCTTMASLIGLPAGSVTRPRAITPSVSLSVAVPCRRIGIDRPVF